MCNFLLTVFVSSLTGVGASFLVWWLTFKHWSPKLRIGTTISKRQTEENESKFEYRFKFENIGRRNIIDVEVIVRLRIQGIKKGTRNWTVIYLPTSSSLEYKKVAIIRPASENGIRPVLEIKLYECGDYFQKVFFPEDIRQKSKNNKLTLEDVMQLGTTSELQILMLGTDEFSGARKFFESKVFGTDDIIVGSFDRNGIDVLPHSSPLTS